MDLKSKLLGRLTCACARLPMGGGHPTTRLLRARWEAWWDRCYGD